MAPLHQSFLAHLAIKPKLVHTGQHYDAQLSDVFFEQLNLPQPDYNLGVSPGSLTQQTADMMRRFESVLMVEQPDWVVVVGDVTSTIACALTAAQMGIRLAHVESGLRSGDRQMPEERNRQLTDHLADALFVTEQAGLDNLRRENIPEERVHFVGNVLIDSLIQYRPTANTLEIAAKLGFQPKGYVLMTMHRPANVDTEAGLLRLIQIVETIVTLIPVIFSLHPRTYTMLVKFGLLSRLIALSGVQILESQGYLEFLNLMESAVAVITDSGGIQEETTYLQVPCLTFRDSTERPVTVDLGTNQLLTDLTPETVRRSIIDIVAGRIKIGQIPPLWDGQTAWRIVQVLTALT
jgi:UDP-N-acetylglucosamine 2-epimerase (non-hydrolysing)